MRTLLFICPNSLFGKAVIVSLVYNTQKYNELRVKKPISRCKFESCFGHHPTKASVEARERISFICWLIKDVY